MEEEDVIKKARKLYNNGQHQECADLLSHLEVMPDLADRLEGQALLGWSLYHLGIKSKNKKVRLLKRAVYNWESAIEFLDACSGTLGKGIERKVKLSASNGLSLALYILGEKERAWRINKEALADFPDPSAENTRLILLRWEGKLEESVEAAENVHKKAMKKNDFRTAAHALQNKADTLRRLGRLGEALAEYKRAKELYKKSDAFHLEAVKKKINLIDLK